MRKALILLLFCTPCFAQEIKPNLHPKALFVADCMATSADFAFTYRLRTEPVFVEHDPIARPFVTHGTPLMAAFFAGKVAAFEGTAWVLRKKHHDRVAAVIQSFSVGLSLDGAVTSARGYNTIH